MDIREYIVIPLYRLSNHIEKGNGSIWRQTAEAESLNEESHGFEEGIGLLGIEDFITRHDSDKVVSVTEVDYIVCPSGNHVDGFNPVSADFELHRLPRVDIPFLYKSVTVNDNELLPFGVIPVLSLGYSGLRDVNRYLPAVKCMYKLRKRAAGI